MKILQKICFVLLLTTFSSVYGGSCFEKPYDVDDCRVKAEQGDTNSQVVLGWLYYMGRGVRKDYKEAVKWYRKAAEQGNAEAQTYLGTMYSAGQGVIQDNVTAHMYFNIAAASGFENAIKGRYLVEEQMTRSQLEKAQDLAREWMRTHQ